MSHSDDDPDATMVLSHSRRRKWIGGLLFLILILALGAVAAYAIARVLVGEPLFGRAPATVVQKQSRGAQNRKEGQLATLHVTTNDAKAIVWVDGKVRGIGRGVTVLRLTPAPQKHSVEVVVLGYPPRWEWVEIPAGKEKTLHIEFGARPAPVAPAPAPVAPRAPPTVPSGPRPFTRAVATLKPGDLVRVVGTHYQVPACLLWGIWKKETSLLASSWRGDRSDWFRGAKIIEDGGKCVERYGTEKCTKHWRALVSLCKQERDGAPIYNPDEVHTSYALAVGPMQHMPGELVKPCSTGSSEYCFTEDAVDFDADGVVDPWSLPDAMAMTALELRHYHEQGDGSWRWATNRYYGSQRGGYYDGTWKQLGRDEIWRNGVKQHWQECCREVGCRESTSRD